MSAKTIKQKLCKVFLNFLKWTAWRSIKLLFYTLYQCYIYSTEAKYALPSLGVCYIGSHKCGCIFICTSCCHNFLFLFFHFLAYKAVFHTHTLYHDKMMVLEETLLIETLSGENAVFTVDQYWHLYGGLVCYERNGLGQQNQTINVSFNSRPLRALEAIYRETNFWPALPMLLLLSHYRWLCLSFKTI